MPQNFDTVYYVAVSDQNGMPTVDKREGIFAFKTGIRVPATWRTAALSFGTWFPYLERPEMKSPMGSPFLATCPHLQPDKTLRAWGLTPLLSTDACNTGLLGLTYGPRAASACIKGSGTV